MQLTPAKIKLKGENEALAIEWSDGHTSAYPYQYLRDKCPCATCSEMGAPAHPAPTPFPILGQKPLKPDHAELVGRYALQIYWNDGHSSGIYSFDYLREMCLCAKCAAKREAAG